MGVLSWQIEDFRAWLVGQSADEVVGFPRSACHCPLVSWRCALGDGGSIGIHDFFYGFTPDTAADSLPLPEWAAQFAFRLDTYAPFERVYPAFCLELLKEIAS